MAGPATRRPLTAHPWAWWGWALGCAGAASLTTNPLLLACLGFAVVAVLLTRRSDDPWARSVGAYFVLAAFVLVVRVFFQAVAGAGVGTTVLLRLPQVPLPGWAAGIRIGGPIMLEPLLYTVYDSLRLGLMLICLGAANALANPKRALRAVPAALYEVSVAIVIALSVAPQLVESTARIRRAQRLRGGAEQGWRAVAAVVIPVLADAIDRSLALAASMEARGFGRTRSDERPPAWASAALLAAMIVFTFGGFLLLAASSPQAQGAAAACLVGGGAAVVFGLRRTGRRVRVSRYRPDPWTPRDTGLLVAGGIAVTTAAVLGSTAFPEAFAIMNPSTDPVVWPTLHPAMALIVAASLAPLALTGAPAPARAQEVA